MCQFCRNAGGFDVTIVEFEINRVPDPQPAPADAEPAPEAAAATPTLDDVRDDPDVAAPAAEPAEPDRMAELREQVREQLGRRTNPFALMSPRDERAAEQLAELMGITTTEARRVCQLITLGTELRNLTAEAATLDLGRRMAEAAERAGAGIGQALRSALREMAEQRRARS